MLVLMHQLDILALLSVEFNNFVLEHVLLLQMVLSLFLSLLGILLIRFQNLLNVLHFIVFESLFQSKISSFLFVNLHLFYLLAGVFACDIIFLCLLQTFNLFRALIRVLDFLHGLLLLELQQGNSILEQLSVSINS